MNEKDVKHEFKTKEGASLEEKLALFEDVLCREISYRNEQNRSIGVSLISFKNILEKLTDGKNLVVNRNVLIEKVNDALIQINKVSLENAHYRSMIVAQHEKIERLENKVKELVSILQQKNIIN